MYREILSRFYIFICSVVVLVSMVANLFGWVNMTALLDYTWAILVLSFILSILGVVIKAIPMLDIHLLTKHTFMSIMKNTLYNMGYCKGNIVVI